MGVVRNRKPSELDKTPHSLHNTQQHNLID